MDRQDRRAASAPQGGRTSERDRVPGLLRLASIELDFEQSFGRRVDLRTRDDLSEYFRAAVIEEARPLNDAA